MIYKMLCLKLLPQCSSHVAQISIAAHAPYEKQKCITNKPGILFQIFLYIWSCVDITYPWNAGLV